MHAGAPLPVNPLPGFRWLPRTDPNPRKLLRDVVQEEAAAESRRAAPAGGRHSSVAAGPGRWYTLRRNEQDTIGHCSAGRVRVVRRPLLPGVAAPCPRTGFSELPQQAGDQCSAGFPAGRIPTCRPAAANWGIPMAGGCLCRRGPLTAVGPVCVVYAASISPRRRAYCA